MMSTFFQLFRKRGFSLTLEILNDFKKKEAKEPVFFQKLKDKDSYLNEFYRVKESLIEHDLVAYKLDKDYNKVIIITEKGQKLLEQVRAIEGFLVKKA